MGIYDREYYRDDEGGAGWFSGVAPATRSFIAIHVALFLAGLLSIGPGGGLPSFYQGLVGQSTLIIRDFQVYRLLTAPFAPNPEGLLALVFQMLILYFVGREMESMYGSREFAWTYVTAAVLSTLAWALFDYFGPNHGRGFFMGPGGAVAAILVLFALYYPNREVLLFFVLPVKMWILLVIFLGIDAISLLNQLRAAGAGARGVGSTMYFAHLAGAAYGWAYKSLDFRWSRLMNFRWLRRPRFRVVAAEPREWTRPARATGTASPKLTTANYVPEEQLDDRVDEILAKIAREGRGSLTEDEQRILQEASRRARNRRSERLS